MPKEINDKNSEGMNGQSECLVKAGDWGIAYSITKQVLTWGKIKLVSPNQKVVWLDMRTNAAPFSGFSRSYVEVFPADKEKEAEERFNELWAKRSEGG
jgi:hypothetical protein